LGQPCIEAERRYLQALAEELRHSRTQAKNAKLVQRSSNNPEQNS